MKVSLLTHNWGHPWVRTFKTSFEGRGHEYAVNEIGKADVYLHGWSDGSTSPLPGKVNIYFWRRYELYTEGWKKIDWSQVDHVVTVNPWVEERVRLYFNGDAPPIKTVLNQVDMNRWTWKKRRHGKKIGMVGHVCAKKNYPMAAQILSQLPKEYELHIAGSVQDASLVDYLDFYGKATKRRIVLYGYVHPDQIDLWWEDKNYCLNTSLSEGCPNCVGEAMAKGIMPVVHSWPGAKDIYPNLNLFSNTVQAVNLIDGGIYNSDRYRKIVERDFSDTNEQIVDLAEQCYANRA